MSARITCSGLELGNLFETVILHFEDATGARLADIVRPVNYKGRNERGNLISDAFEGGSFKDAYMRASAAEAVRTWFPGHEDGLKVLHHFNATATKCAAALRLRDPDFRGIAKRLAKVCDEAQVVLDAAPALPDAYALEESVWSAMRGFASNSGEDAPEKAETKPGEKPKRVRKAKAASETKTSAKRGRKAAKKDDAA